MAWRRTLCALAVLGSLVGQVFADNVNVTLTDNIQEKANGAENNGTLLFESGTYVFASQVQIQSSLGLVGFGSDETIFEKTGNHRFFRFTDGQGHHVAAGGESGIQNITFSSLGGSISGDGGAIYCSNFGGGIQNSVFSGNGATGDLSYGGAIYCNNFGGSGDEGLADLGGSFFVDNEAGNSGGAIAISCDGKLCAETGDVVFQRNAPNAIYFCNLVANNTAAIGAAEGNTFYLYDAISSNSASSYKNLTIQINPESGHTGTVLFDQYVSDMWFQGSGSAAVSHGTMALQNGAGFGADGNTGTFTVESNATLAIAYGQMVPTYAYESDVGVYVADESAITYDGEHLSKINANAFNVDGALQFLLPENVSHGDILLQTPAAVTFGANAELRLEVQSATELDLNRHDRIVLLHSTSETQLNWTDFAAKFSGSMPVDDAKKHRFRLELTDQQLAAEYFPWYVLLPEDVGPSAVDSGRIASINEIGDSSDTIYLESELYTFADQVEFAKDFGLVGDASGATVLEKIGNHRFFKFTGAAGGESGIQNITFSSLGGSVSGDGGAIYCSNFGGGVRNSVFSGNGATANGGAIYCSNFGGSGDEGLVDLGGSFFVGNEAGNFGGAIAISCDGKLCAETGDVVFQRNAPNAIYFGNFGENNTAAIGAAEGNMFYLYDAISSNSTFSYKNLTIQINPESGHTGTVLFDQYVSDMWFQGSGSAAVSHGTMVLQNGAGFGADGNTGTFTVESNATLAIAYERPVSIYQFNGTSVEERAIETPYYVETSRINCNNLQIEGAVQFILPSDCFYGGYLPAMIASNDVFIGEDATISVGVSDGTDEEFALAVGETLVLLKADGKLSCAADFSLQHAKFIPGARPGYEFAVELDSENNRLLARLLASAESKNIYGIAAKLFYEALCEGHLTKAAAVNRCGDLAAGDVIDGACSAVGAGKNAAYFTTCGWGRDRYETGSYVDLRGPSLAAGMAYGINATSARIVCGLFFELASGSCRTKNGDGVDIVDGGGNCSAIGAGIMARADFKKQKSSGANFDISFHGGSVENKWGGGALAAEYVSKGSYCGGHVGCGYAFEAGKELPINLYGKYLLAISKGGDVSAGGGVSVKFDSLKSQRARLGGRLEPRGVGCVLSPWCDVYFEHEFSAKASIVGAGEMQSPSLKGNCAVGQIGVKYSPAPVFVDLSLRGSVGSRKGFGFDLRVGREF